ncbi:MAG TPA: TonB-dependent receptor, partial [Chitinophagaceae bacterium]|nr:TonB-dependent receptor [Chitinophagaceae bacterium]
KRFANFGAVGAAWIFSKEKFIMQKLPFISFGKFRMSYGLTGNDQIADYGYLDTYTPAPFPYQGNAAVYPTGLFNADYGWETNKKLEAGLELGLFHDRLLFSLDYYNNRSSNQLVGLPLAPTTGFNIVQFNLPATVQNTGLEMEIESSIIRTKHFTWSSEFTITIPRNKLLSYPNLEGSPYARIYEVGKSLFIQRKLHVEGVDSKTGLYDIQDVNGNGNSFDIPDDLQSLKQVSQQYYGGLNNNLHFKNWDVSMFIQFVKQTGFNYLYGGVFAMPGTLGNQPSLVLNNWKAPGDIAGSQVLSQSYGSLAYQSYSTVDVYGDNVIGDASYVRLKNLSVSYSLPAKWFQKLKSIQCRVFIKGQNLLTFTNYQGLDPENNGANRLPPLKTTVAGLVITL